MAGSGGGASRKISASSARSHTRRSKSNSKSTLFPKGILKKFLIVFFIGFLAWAYQATHPPPPKICGSPDGPPVTSPRIKLRDGRHLSYLEYGVSKETAQHKIIYVHGFDNCKHHNLFALASAALIEELGVYSVSFDRPGYGESDPDPKRTLKSLALDIEELADQLGLGSRFYVVGMSMGGNFVWPCLKYIPHRLAGVAFVAPVINYWWSSFPANLSNEAYYYKQFKPDQWSLRVAHHIPWLTYWWNTQKWFPSSSVASQSVEMFSPPDMEVLSKFPGPTEAQKTQPRQQGEYESLHRDLMIGFGKWEFDPMKLENPFPNNEGSVHLWMGDDDRFVPVTLQRYIAQQLPWINYHELTRAGHLFAFADGMTDTILKTLLNVKE